MKNLNAIVIIKYLSKSVFFIGMLAGPIWFFSTIVDRFVSDPSLRYILTIALSAWFFITYAYIHQEETTKAKKEGIAETERRFFHHN